jgi:hypothetical protein
MTTRSTNPAIKTHSSDGKTWSIEHAPTGMQVGVITGKRRLRAVLSLIEHAPDNGWIEFANTITAWRRANPRSVRVSP